jgi:ribosomal protein L14E/L6E/L27E
MDQGVLNSFDNIKNRYCILLQITTESMNNHQIAATYYRELEAQQMRQKVEQSEPEKIEPKKVPEPIVAPEETPTKKQEIKNFFEIVKQLVIKHLKKKR